MNIRRAVSYVLSHPVFKSGLKIGGFLAAGLPSFALAVPLNWFLVEMLSWPEPAAYAVVLLFQVILNFFMCRWFVFKDRKQTAMLVQFYQFVAGILFFRIADWALYTAVVHYTAIHYLVAQVANVFIFVVLKFKFSQKVMER
jgi:putative flippase GtrA